ncbi:MAG: ribonuclease P protein component [Acidimicrobiales bacterium]
MRSRRGLLSVTWLPEPGAGPPRVAYAVGRRVGGSVQRNRVRRRLRHLVRPTVGRLAPGAYLIVAAPAALQASVATLGRCLEQALQDLGALANAEQASPPGPSSQPSTDTAG